MWCKRATELYMGTDDELIAKIWITTNYTIHAFQFVCPEDKEGTVNWSPSLGSWPWNNLDRWLVFNVTVIKFKPIRLNFVFDVVLGYHVGIKVVYYTTSFYRLKNCCFEITQLCRDLHQSGEIKREIITTLYTLITVLYRLLCNQLFIILTFWDELSSDKPGWNTRSQKFIEINGISCYWIWCL